MTLIHSLPNPRSDEYQSNRQAMSRLVAELETRQAQVRAGGGDKGVHKFRERGKLLPRERLELLLDPGSPFLELSPLAAWGMYNGESPGGSQITGIGRVNGIGCLSCDLPVGIGAYGNCWSLTAVGTEPPIF